LDGTTSGRTIIIDIDSNSRRKIRVEEEYERDMMQAELLYLSLSFSLYGITSLQQTHQACVAAQQFLSSTSLNPFHMQPFSALLILKMKMKMRTQE
jgi:hypothetical protein